MHIIMFSYTLSTTQGGKEADNEAGMPSFVDSTISNDHDTPAEASTRLLPAPFQKPNANTPQEH